MTVTQETIIRHITNIYTTSVNIGLIILSLANWEKCLMFPLQSKVWYISDVADWFFSQNNSHFYIVLKCVAETTMLV